MTATRTAVLAKAASQIGISEIPRGSNRVPYTGWYGLGPAPWCDIFVSWVADQTGAVDILGRFAYTPSHAAWFKARGQWHRSGPQVGDLAFYDFGLGRISHVGFVEKLLPGGLMQTIEGNTDVAGGRTGGKVMRKTRSRTQYVVGYGRPAYRRVVQQGSGLPTTGPTVKGWQTLLAFAPERRDGAWGPATDQRSAWLRTAAAAVDSHLSGSRRSTVELVQRVIGATADGDWGPKSRTAMRAWIRRVQRFLGFAGKDVDGDWGPKTDRAYLAFRKAHVGRY